ncbi:MAG: DUF5686 and carboxypeptidase regulatory-like domain-containing protein [Gilvibacter sp.]
MRTTLLFLISLICANCIAQISGKVTNNKGEALPFVNIYVQNSYTGTTSNELGLYLLNPEEKGDLVLVYQFLGYETITKNISFSGPQQTIDVVMQETSLDLDQVVVNANENPANRIIREAIAKRKENLNRIKAFTADFYSKGIWRVKDVPEKILGQEVGDFEGALDSTRSGIIYLSETISEIAFNQPDDFKEKILASKVSGNDNGFSFNSARDANFSFYNNTVDLNAQIVSPIAREAFNYYRFQLEGVFYEGSSLINKIKVTPKRPKDRVWSGTIYIVEDDWEIYGAALTTTGEAIQVPFIDELIFKQSFTYDEAQGFWVKISQTIDFSFGLFGVNGDGRFTAGYSNYDFTPQFEKRSFTNEVLTFAERANEKDSLFWDTVRPVPLTGEEINDYVRKDSIQTLRKSKTYLDSIDLKGNRVKPFDILTGYSYRNSYKRWNVSYRGPKAQFNTLQGYTPNIGVNFFKSKDENFTRWTSLNGTLEYGVDDDRLRYTLSGRMRFNAINRSTLSISGGTAVVQFNAQEPISPLVNSISSLFFERNFLKAYESDFITVGYSQEVFNGLRMSSTLGYEKRQPLFNQSDQVYFRNSGVSYTSNNPLAPTDFSNAAILEHDIVKANVSAFISFGEKYMTYPYGKFNIGNEGKFPRLIVDYEGGFNASNSDYNYHQFQARVTQGINLGNKGRFRYNLTAGSFLNGDNISFVDYKHFNGNQTRINNGGSYTNVFNNLPYYQLSTNDSYFEAHAEHNFRGWVLGKIPGLNSLNFNLVVGGHMLSTPDNNPYFEYSVGIDNIGFGKFRLLRVDYVRSIMGGQQSGVFVFGLKFLNILD